jgi:hypothetical protein
LAAAGGADAKVEFALVHDLVGAADRVRAEALHQAKRGVATPVRHGDRAGVGRFEGHGLGEARRKCCMEEDTVGTWGRESDTDARRLRHDVRISPSVVREERRERRRGSRATAVGGGGDWARMGG